MHIDFQVGIVGAGFGGLIAALNLKRSGRDSFVLFEKASEIGGVWRENIYPGCACDVKSNLYSITGEKNPDWSSNYPGQQEILQYLQGIAVKNEILQHIRFGTAVIELSFIPEKGAWMVKDHAGGTCCVKNIIMATGPHHRPKLPNFKGIGSFKGKAFHSARWDPEVDMSGKRVAVVGTGASAIQIVPAIAPSVSKLMVFQRTPAWVLPRSERKNSTFTKFIYRNIPMMQHIDRELAYWTMEVAGLAFFGYEHIHRLLLRLSLQRLERQVYNPLIREKLTPRYKMGCKRICISDDYYPTFNRSNVYLITNPICEIAENGIITDEGELSEVDIIVFATGFSVADIDDYARITGLDGRILTDEWSRTGAEAYLGINVSGFPNLSFILGPNSGLSHSSAIHVMESQMKYILNYIKMSEKTGDDGYLDVKANVQSAYNAQLQNKLKDTIWSSGCSSWYLNKNGKNTTIFPGLTNSYRKTCRKFYSSAYQFINTNERKIVAK